MAGVMVTALLAVLAGSWIPQAAGEVFRLDHEEVPGAYSLHARYLFYATVKEGKDKKPETYPQATFDDLRITKSGSNLQNYDAVQVSLIPWDDFDKLVDKDSFCDSDKKLVLQKFPAKSLVTSVTVPAAKITAQKAKVKKTGVYVLVITNCGSETDLSISGSISVKNPFGYLPGNDYHRLPFYGWVSLIWAGAGILWAGLIVIKRDAVVWLHISLAWVLVSGFAESIGWWVALSQTNAHGEAIKATTLAEVLTVMRNIYAFTFVLIASMGLGVTESELSRGSKIKIMVASSLFGMAAVPRVCLSTVRQAVSPSDTIVVLSEVPLVIVAAGISIFVLNRLVENMKRSKELSQPDSLKIFQRLAAVTALVLLSSVGVMIGQFLDKPGRSDEFWKSHAFWGDGLSQGIALTALAFTMFFLAPSKSGFLAEAYMTQLGDEDDDKEDEAFAANANNREHDAEDPMNLVAQDGEDDSQPIASTIGAAAE